MNVRFQESFFKMVKWRDLKSLLKHWDKRVWESVVRKVWKRGSNSKKNERKNGKTDGTDEVFDEGVDSFTSEFGWDRNGEKKKFRERKKTSIGK